MSSISVLKAPARGNCPVGPTFTVEPEAGRNFVKRHEHISLDDEQCTYQLGRWDNVPIPDKPFFNCCLGELQSSFQQEWEAVDVFVGGG